MLRKELQPYVEVNTHTWRPLAEGSIPGAYMGSYLGLEHQAGRHVFCIMRPAVSADEYGISENGYITYPIVDDQHPELLADHLVKAGLSIDEAVPWDLDGYDPEIDIIPLMNRLAEAKAYLPKEAKQKEGDGASLNKQMEVQWNSDGTGGDESADTHA